MPTSTHVCATDFEFDDMDLDLDHYDDPEIYGVAVLAEANDTINPVAGAGAEPNDMRPDVGPAGSLNP